MAEVLNKLKDLIYSYATVEIPNTDLLVFQGTSTCSKALEHQKTTGTSASKLVCDALETN